VYLHYPGALPLPPTDAKAAIRLSNIVRDHVVLRRNGHELVGLCPFHDEKTPSFHVNDQKAVYFCFGCSASGDAITFLRQIEGLSFTEAVARLGGELPRRERKLPEPRAPDPEKLASIELARRIWHDARPIAGTLGEHYLRGRGILGRIPPSLRFAWTPLWHNLKSGRTGPRMPGVICACQDGNGRVTGIQRILLDRTGTKAAIPRPKRNIGQVRGGALRLGAATKTVILCEGPEDGLTLAMRYPELPVWVALGTGGLPYVVLPGIVHEVILAGDNNAPGRIAVARAQEVYAAQNRRTTPHFPPKAFEDFNDELRDVRIAA